MTTTRYAEHIELSQTNGRCTITVQDYELLDFLDDLLTDSGIEIVNVLAPTIDRPGHGFELAPSVSSSTVSALLAGIPPEEITRILALNNPSPTE